MKNSAQNAGATSGIRDVDRILAANILIELGIDQQDRLETVARHLARHREESANWAAERAHSGILQALADRLRADRRERRAEWYDGFREAEATVVITQPAELLGPAPATPRTAGSILRSMIRQARGNGGPAMRR